MTKKKDDVATHQVVVTKTSSRKLQELWLGVYVQEKDDWERAMFSRLFAQASCWRASTPDTADLVVFSGGVDVDPQLYGEKPHPRTESPSPTRDASDAALWEYCVSQGIPMTGICRGAQFGHVMAGGKLYQHLERETGVGHPHYGDHGMYDHVNKKYIERISSVHHQAVVPNQNMRIVGTANFNTETKWLNDKKKADVKAADIEAFMYEDILFFGVQGHPEYAGYDEFAQWYIQQIYDRIVVSPNVKWDGSVLRVVPEQLEKNRSRHQVKKNTKLKEEILINVR